jgi:hypothetical protein
MCGNQDRNYTSALELVFMLNQNVFIYPDIIRQPFSMYFWSVLVSALEKDWAVSVKSKAAPFDAKL